MKYLIYVAWLIIIIIVGPLLTIWSLNTLFPTLNIPFGIDTWFATMMIQSILVYRAEIK